MLGDGQLATGLDPGEQVKFTVTSELFQPRAFEVGLATALIEGGIGGGVCTFTVTFALAVFPAMSVAVPLKLWLIPAVVTVTGEGQFATPDKASEQVNVIVTGSVVFTPFDGVGETEYEITGEVVSMLTVVVAVAVFPAASVADALTL